MDNYTIPEQTYINYKEKEIKNKRAEMGLRENYNIFKLSVRQCLISEALFNIISDTLPTESHGYAKSLCENYVQEHRDIQSLLNRMSRQSQMLAEMVITINETNDTIMKNVDKDNDLTFIINPKDMTTFYDKLNNSKDSNITKAITSKVCDAAEKYVQDNIKIKAELDRIANKTKDKIDKINARNEDVKATLEESYKRQEKAAISNVHNKRFITVYENIIRRVYKNVLKDQSIQENFSDDNGSISIDKIEEMSNTLYTFLEMLNTCKLEVVDKDFIIDSLNSI